MLYAISPFFFLFVYLSIKAIISLETIPRYNTKIKNMTIKAIAHESLHFMQMSKSQHKPNISNIFIFMQIIT